VADAVDPGLGSAWHHVTDRLAQRPRDALGGGSGRPPIRPADGADIETPQPVGHAVGGVGREARHRVARRAGDRDRDLVRRLVQPHHAAAGQARPADRQQRRSGVAE